MSQTTPNESVTKKEPIPNQDMADFKTKQAKSAETNSATVEKATVSLGEQFKQAREKLNLSIEDVAHKINLRTAILQSIENNELKHPSIPPAFMRGYVQSYAKFLRLPDDVVPTLENAYGEARKSDLSKNTRARKSINRDSSHSWIGCITWIIVFAALGMTALWWWENYQKSNLERDNLVESYIPADENKDSGSLDNTVPVNPQTIAPVPTPAENKPAETAQATGVKPTESEKTEVVKPTAPVKTPEPEVVASVPTQPALNVNTDNTAAPLVLKNLDAPTTGVPAAPEAENSPLSSKDALQSEMNKIDDRTASATTDPASDNQNANAENAQPAENTASAQNPATEQATLRIEVTGPSCWISVKDGKRKLLAQQEYKQGEVLTFNAGDAYSLIIGAPGNVKITYQGNQVPLKVDGRVAKFKLPRL